MDACHAASSAGSTAELDEVSLMQLPPGRHRGGDQHKLSLMGYAQKTTYWLWSHAAYAWQKFRQEDRAHKLALSESEQREQSKADAAALAAEQEEHEAWTALTAAREEAEKAEKFAARKAAVEEDAVRAATARKAEGVAHRKWDQKKGIWLDKQRIPHILHRVLMPSETTGHGSCGFSQWGDYRELFHKENPGWQEWLWSEAEIDALLRKQHERAFAGFPGLHNFTEVFNNLKPWVKKKDVAPYVVLHAFGGLFMDHDMLCSNPVKNSLARADIVMREGFRVNFVASTPGRNLWLEMLAAVANVSKDANADHMGPCDHTGQYVLEKVFTRMRRRQGERFEGMRMLGEDVIGDNGTTCSHRSWGTWGKDWYGGGWGRGKKFQAKPTVCRNFTREEGMRNLLCDCPRLFTNAVYGEDLREIAQI